MCNNFRSIYFLLFIVFLPVYLYSQPNTMFYLRALPQSVEINPSFHNDSAKFWIGVPLLSGIQAEVNTGGVTWNDAIMEDPENYDSLLVDLNGFVDALQKNNFLFEETSIALISFGFRQRDNNFFFSVNERQVAKGTYNKTFAEFLRDGNVPYQGETLDFNNPWGEFVHFREYAFGASRKINQKLTLGATAKILYGKSVVNMKFSDLTLYTSDISEGNKVRITSEALLRFSAPFRVTLNEEGLVSSVTEDFPSVKDYLFNTENSGFSIGAGATYQAKPGVTLSASVMDLGFINWKSDVQQLEQKGEYAFEGLNLKPFIDDGELAESEIIDAYTELVDSIADNFRIIEGGNTFTTSLPAKIYLGARFYSSDNLHWGILSRTRIYGGKLEENLTLSGNMKVTDFLSVSGSWSISKGKYNNLGLGILTETGNLQIYAASDNVPAFFYPTINPYFDFRFGMNLIFREKKKKIKAWAPSTCKSLSRSPQQRMKKR